MHLPKYWSITASKEGKHQSSWASARLVLTDQGTPNCQPRVETGLTGGFCTASCWKVTVKTGRFLATYWLAFLSSNLVPEEALGTGCL